jgi:predicted amidohydrolase
MKKFAVSGLSVVVICTVAVRFEAQSAETAGQKAERQAAQENRAQHEQLVVAMAQYAFLLDNVPANIAKAEAVCTEAAAKGAKVVVFPETALTGSLENLPEGTDFHRHAVRLPGPETKRFAEIARRLDIGIVMCTAEVGEEKKLYNSAFVVTPGGYQGKFRKLFPAPGEKAVTVHGRATPVFEIFGWRCGIGICYDIYFPEVARMYALKGADVFLVPTGGTGLPPEQVHAKWWKPHFNLAGFMKVCPARALDNGFYVLLPVSADAGGGSVAVDPRGEQIAYAAGDEELILVTLRRDLVEKARTVYLPDLRAEVFRDLAEVSERSDD